MTRVNPKSNPFAGPCQRRKGLGACVPVRMGWGLLLLIFVLAGLPRTVSSGSVTCADVVRESTRMTRAAKGRSPVLGDLAKRVGAEPAFVERCMHAFGRRVRREREIASERAAAVLEHMEGDEAEESFPEDVEEPGAAERPKREPKPRYLSIRPTPGYEEGADLLPGEQERYDEDLERERE
ncbi:MAG: hypothetical protein KatS3mg077_3055 [Candidatus Binatia bacterium]|nr:MAG: hypothetical protein KatS3mg077_3055 [Candidatus Binatia bacterium]